MSLSPFWRLKISMLLCMFRAFTLMLNAQNSQKKLK